jgi:probable blue pigment (indigoidine) exporter
LLVPVAFWSEPALPQLTLTNWLGFIYLGLIGGALTYLLWFRGLARLEPSVAASLGFLSPLTAVILGWALLNQQLNGLQMAGMLIVLISVWLGQRVQTR